MGISFQQKTPVNRPRLSTENTLANWIARAFERLTGFRSFLRELRGGFWGRYRRPAGCQSAVRQLFSHGTCRPFVAVLTSTITRRMTSLIDSPGDLK